MNRPKPAKRAIWPRTKPRFGALVLFSLNIWICWRLFFTEYTEHFGSVHSFFLAIARGIRTRWPDLGWWSLWNAGGMPFEYTYQPLLHHIVAATAGLTGWPEARAYHFVLGILFSLGPVTLYALVLQITRRPGVSFLAGLLHTFLSPSAILISDVAIDMGGWNLPRRVFTGVVWADAPNVVGLTLIPLAILFLDRALKRPAMLSWAWAAIAIASVPLTNIPATIALAMAVAAYALALDWDSWPRFWPQIAGGSLGGWLLFAPWLPPSGLMLAASNVQWMNREGQFSMDKLPFYLAGAGILILLLIAMRLLKVGIPVRFAALFTLLSAFPSLLSAWYRVDVIAQAGRFHLAMDLAIVLLIAALLPKGLQWTPLRRNVFVGVILAACAFQWDAHRYAIRRMTQRVNVTDRSEYKIARWMEDNAHGDRILAAGSTAFWLNHWTDTPQVAGCCDQNMLLPVIPMARYVIGTDDGTEGRGAYISTLWMQVLGVHYVAVTGPGSTDMYEDYRNPTKFDGMLRERWRDGGDVIYEVPLASASLAHAVSPNELVSRVPVNGIDTEPLEGYRSALLDQSRPQAAFSWANTHEATIRGTLPRGWVFSLQIPYHAGWKAESDGPVGISRDALGFMFVTPQCAGPCEVHLRFDGGVERTELRAIAIMTWIALGVLVARERRRRTHTLAA